MPLWADGQTGKTKGEIQQMQNKVEVISNQI